MGAVTHTRYQPLRNGFRHAHFQWLVDLDALPGLARPTRWLAHFDARDHLDGGRLGGGIRGDVERFLVARGIDLDSSDRVLMLANARVLGHTFDPLSVFWCVGPDGAVRAVMFEVHNTYGGRHAYLLDVDDRGRAGVDKAFYVSPFNDTSGRYDVRLRLTPERVSAIRASGPMAAGAGRNGLCMAGSPAGTPPDPTPRRVTPP